MKPPQVELEAVRKNFENDNAMEANGRKYIPISGKGSSVQVECNDDSETLDSAVEQGGPDMKWDEAPARKLRDCLDDVVDTIHGNTPGNTLDKPQPLTGVEPSSTKKETQSRDKQSKRAGIKRTTREISPPDDKNQIPLRKITETSRTNTKRQRKGNDNSQHINDIPMASPTLNVSPEIPQQALTNKEETAMVSSLSVEDGQPQVPSNWSHHIRLTLREILKEEILKVKNDLLEDILQLRVSTSESYNSLSTRITDLDTSLQKILELNRQILNSTLTKEVREISATPSSGQYMKIDDTRSYTSLRTTELNITETLNPVNRERHHKPEQNNDHNTERRSQPSKRLSRIHGPKDPRNKRTLKREVETTSPFA